MGIGILSINFDVVKVTGDCFSNFCYQHSIIIYVAKVIHLVACNVRNSNGNLRI